ncbi:MAG: hypothetical protein LKJ86_09045 [Oscillibacter sp.]|jgi:hypothetical protein|nr:hypothetical protein [Oscillibacter sp.]
MMGKEKKYPSKTTLNLAQKEREKRDLGAVVPVAILLALGIAAFCKFGVVDRLNALSQAEAQAAQAEAQTAQLADLNANYDSLLQEYQSYSVAQSALTGGADPMDCLGLIERELLTKADVTSFTVAPDTITVAFSGVTLNEISAIYLNLMKSDLVSGVQVYTAATESEKKAAVSATMTVKLAVETSGEGAAE